VKKEKTIGFKHYLKKGKGASENHYLRVTFDRLSTNFLIPQIKPSQKDIAKLQNEITQVIRYFESTDPNFSIQGIKERHEACFNIADDHFELPVGEKIEHDAGDILTHNQFIAVFIDDYIDDEKHEQYRNYRYIRHAKERHLKQIFKKLQLESKLLLLLEIALVDFCNNKPATVIDFLIKREVLNNFIQFTKDNMDEINLKLGLELKTKDLVIENVKSTFLSNFYESNDFLLVPHFK